MKFSTGLVLALVGTSFMVNAGSLPQDKDVSPSVDKHLGNNGTHVDHGKHLGHGKGHGKGHGVEHGKDNGKHLGHFKDHGKNNGKHLGKEKSKSSRPPKRRGGSKKKKSQHKKRPNHKKKKPTPTATPPTPTSFPTATPSATKPSTGGPSNNSNIPSNSASGLSSSEISHVLDLHNSRRAKHSSPPLTWNEKAAAFAASWVSKCNWGHSNNREYGENIAQGQRDFDQVLKNWYDDEEEKYDFNNPGFSPYSGHFSAVIWKSTKTVGCAVHDCPGGKYYSCNYYEPGNYLNEFEENVLPKTN
ncbi:unnamed protein product [Cunninghamella echinulata]